MTKENELILEAYATMGKKPKIEDVGTNKKAKMVKEAEEAEKAKEGEKTEDADKLVKVETPVEPEAVVEAGEVASKPGTYVDFTGKLEAKGIIGKVENASFNIEEDNNVTWNKGTWLDGVWSARGGVWNNGTWKDGTWKNGLWMDGTWENGTHKGGIFAGGTWKNGTWEYGVFDGGTWEDGTWRSGDWAKEAKWIKGKDSKGIEQTKAPFHWGNMEYSKVRDTSKFIDTDKKEDKSKSYAADDKVEYKTGEKGIDTFDDDAQFNVSESVRKNLVGKKILGRMLQIMEDIEKEDDEISDDEYEFIQAVKDENYLKIDEIIKNNLVNKDKAFIHASATGNVDVTKYIVNTYNPNIHIGGIATWTPGNRKIEKDLALEWAEEEDFSDMIDYLKSLGLKSIE